MKPTIPAELLRYCGLCLLPSCRFRVSRQRAANMVISLTTLPSRIKNIRPTIASLCDQTIQPEKIILNIPKESRREKCGYVIPEFLKNNPLVLINEVEEDLGPATKLLPTLKKYWNEHEQKIIVVDDDEIYPKMLVENYLKYADEYSNAVLTLVGWDAPEDADHHHRLVRYGAIGSKPRNSERVNEPVQVDCVQGASSFMVRSTFFTDEIFDYSQAPREAFFVDDIYVSGHLATNSIPVMVIPAPFRFARMKVSTHLILSETLHKKENSSGHNNNTLYQFYESAWHSHKSL